MFCDVLPKVLLPRRNPPSLVCLDIFRADNTQRTPEHLRITTPEARRFAEPTAFAGQSQAKKCVATRAPFSLSQPADQGE